jgi:hypothetical protein
VHDLSADSLALPPELYPAFAPLPVPLAQHLILQEYRRYRRVVPSRRPSPRQIWARVWERVSKARLVAYEYLHPFVVVEQRRRQQELPRLFPTAPWLLDTLATYTPEGKRNAEPTVDLWQQRGLVRREKPRGMLSLQSVAALLVTRIAEEEHQRNWLPSLLLPEEPDWWCYSQQGPTAPILPMPIPLPPTLAGTTLLWTPWLGATWQADTWRSIGLLALRWAGDIVSAHDLEEWDHELATTILRSQTHLLIGQQSIQTALVQEASRLVLERVAHQVDAHTAHPFSSESGEVHER